MAEKPEATENKAKDVETPKEKRIDLPDAAKVEITRMTQKLDNYLAGVVAGLGIKGKWAYDMQSMQFIVED